MLEVVILPAVKVRAPFTVLEAPKVTPAALLIVKLFTPEVGNSTPAVIAVVPLYVTLVVAPKVGAAFKALPDVLTIVAPAPKVKLAAPEKVPVPVVLRVKVPLTVVAPVNDLLLSTPVMVRFL